MPEEKNCSDKIAGPLGLEKPVECSWSLPPVLKCGMEPKMRSLTKNNYTTSNCISNARAVLREAFENDSYFESGYLDNIAMVLHDEAGMPQPQRDRIAKLILDKIVGTER